jgi:hypothetical protein
MTVPAAPGGAGYPPEAPAGWLVLTASERGAAHIAVHTPNQDSVAVERAGVNGVVAAVADGHGHSRHLRSGRGSRFAVGIGCRVGQEFADQLTLSGADLAELAARGGPNSAPAFIAKSARAFLVPTVISRWREAVLGDVAADPFTDQEQDRRWPGDDPTIAYGSTLLLCVALDDWLVMAQIGDGDIVVVLGDGSAALPVPPDPQLDGLVTTSLCGSDAIDDFRVAVVNTAQTSLLAALLATDGYGNAQVVDEWPTSFGKDLAGLLKERDTRWLASQLPGWAARCASADGSADDTTVALLISPAGQAAQPSTPPGASAGLLAHPATLGSEDTTIPADMGTDAAR